MAFLENNPDVVLLGTWWEEITETGDHIQYVERPTSHQEIIDSLGSQNPFGHPCVVFKRDAVLGIGGYPEHFTFAQDRMTWVRICCRYRTANLPQVLVKVRNHGTQATKIAERSSTRRRENYRILRHTLREPDLTVRARAACRQRLAKSMFSYAVALKEEKEKKRMICLLLDFSWRYSDIWIRHLRTWFHMLYRAVIV